MNNSSVEEIIRRAMEEGQFDDLPGKGQPLQLDQNPHQNPEWRAAHNILKSGGFSLPWIESLREIESHLNEARSNLTRTWSWYQTEVEEVNASSHADTELQRAMETFREQIASINEEIRSYNLQAPNDRFQLTPLNEEHEIEQIQSQRQ